MKDDQRFYASHIKVHLQVDKGHKDLSDIQVSANLHKPIKVMVCQVPAMVKSCLQWPAVQKLAKNKFVPRPKNFHSHGLATIVLQFVVQRDKI